MISCIITGHHCCFRTEYLCQRTPLNRDVNYVHLKVPQWARGPSSFGDMISWNTAFERKKLPQLHRNAFVRMLGAVFSFHLLKDHED